MAVNWKDQIKYFFPNRVREFFRWRGYDIVRRDQFSPEEHALVEFVRPFTGTTPQRVIALADAVRYITQAKIEGDIVECGVWRGGSMMAAAKTLLELGDTSRELYLFDTFEGMTPPTEKDVMFDGTPAEKLLQQADKAEGAGNYWCVAGIDDVRQNMSNTGYPMSKVHLVKGRVEDTIPSRGPERIALLRLDTDWYESTKHELDHYYSRLSKHGVLIIDDYGHWQGSRRAVDEFFARLPFRPLMSRLDYSGRMMIKP
jgi:O-methyltransferase